MPLQNSTSLLEESQIGHSTVSRPGPEERTLLTVILVTAQVTVISGITCFFGIISNIINMIIFLKQGLDNTINISLFSLAVSDLISVFTLEWAGICNNPLVYGSDIPLDTREVAYITGGWPHLCFGHIACWITAYITAERCLCIALPLKVKKIITPRRTSIIIGIVYVINIIPFIPECTLVYVDYRYTPGKNSSLYRPTLAVRADQGAIGGVAYILLGVLGTACFPAVILFTAILVVRLRHQVKWRQISTTKTSQRDANAKRETRIMKMVAFVAAILIVCYTPGILASVATFIDPSFSMIGRSNLFLMIWSGVLCFEALNSSVNIFLYYRMSTQYRKTFHEVLGVCVKCGNTSGNEYDADCE